MTESTSKPQPLESPLSSREFAEDLKLIAELVAFGGAFVAAASVIWDFGNPSNIFIILCNFFAVIGTAVLSILLFLTALQRTILLLSKRDEPIRKVKPWREVLNSPSFWLQTFISIVFTSIIMFALVDIIETPPSSFISENKVAPPQQTLLQ
ncbi:hypothetical protein [Flexibacterium corallicola]|uniref:hypothetical protein n=1 Tax=Flexibacterium corallicola TaxID=3037259 RepID=UPI00286F2B75|nr:hypothetical protein [Pseudovibrio sp. M1P-2-3]